MKITTALALLLFGTIAQGATPTSGQMRIGDCNQERNFREIKTKCKVVTHKRVPVKRCKRFADGKPVCRWVMQRVKEGRTKVITRERSPY